MRVAGVMSGTSLDGIDVAIVEIRGRRFETLAFRSFPYSHAVRDAILAISNTATTTAAIARMHVRLGELYAQAVIETCRAVRMPLRSVQLIGCHGQTIFHEADPVNVLGRRVASTLQIGQGDIIAERTGVPVVSDFRPRDMAAGGKGAPLVPYVDYLLFRHASRGRVALNIGGIANITAIPPGARPQQVIAFDTGPGNMIIDSLMRAHTGGKQAFDRAGRIARSGRVDHTLLQNLLRDPYYGRKPPKAAGREQYGREFVERLRSSGRTWRDLVATATILAAASIALGIRRHVMPRMRVDEVIVSGGGAHNPVIMEHLAGLLPEAAVSPSSEFGIDIDAKEAIAFALLANETWHRRPSNLPAATGARTQVVLGKISL